MPASAVYSLLLKKDNAHDDPIYCCAWTKTNTTGDTKGALQDFIVTGGLDTLIKVWTMENNKLVLLHTLEGHCMAVVSLAVSPDGHTLASTSLDSNLIIWDITSGNKVHSVQTGAADVWKVVFSPDGSQVAAGSHTGKINVYGVQSGVVERVLDTRGKFALSVAWSANGKYMSSGAVDGTVCVFDAAQGKLLHTIEAHADAVTSISFTPDSRHIVTASHDGYVKTFDTASGGSAALSSLELRGWVSWCCVSPDGSRAAVAAADGSVRVALLDGLKTLNTFRDHTNTVCGVQFNADSNKLLSVSKDKSINIYECPIPPKNSVKK